MSLLIRTLGQSWPLTYSNTVLRILRPSFDYQRIIPFQAQEYSAFTDKVKNAVVNKWGRYWRDLIKDYTDVFKETAENAKGSPKKTLALCSLFGLTMLCFKTNPDSVHFRDSVLQCSNELLLVPKTIRNPKVDQYLTSMENCFNLGVVRRLNFGIMSVIWIDNDDNALGIYKAKCSYLKPEYITFTNRIVDFGFFGRWWKLESIMEDYDVNIDEWNKLKN